MTVLMVQIYGSYWRLKQMKWKLMAAHTRMRWKLLAISFRKMLNCVKRGWNALQIPLLPRCTAQCFCTFALLYFCTAQCQQTNANKPIFKVRLFLKSKKCIFAFALQPIHSMNWPLMYFEEATLTYIHVLIHAYPNQLQLDMHRKRTNLAGWCFVEKQRLSVFTKTEPQVPKLKGECR